MDADLFLQQFGHLAQGEGGIKKLRDVILQLAVCGKLVEQNSTDEPAKILLKKIEAERKTLVKDGKIKTSRLTPTTSLVETPFDLPYNWAWTRLGNIGSIFNGNSISVSEKEREYTNRIEGYNYIATKDVDFLSRKINYDNGIKIPFGNKGFKVAHKGAVLICAEGGSAGKKIAITEEDICFGNKLYAIETFSGLLPRYLFYVYQSPYFYKEFSLTTTGIIGGTSINKFNQIPVPIPPFEDQKRIVAKVDELMALCDKLEAEQKAQRTLKTQAVQSTLHHLTSAESPASFGTSLNILERTFGNWFDDLATVKHLRATILQMAVQGKLVPQNPTDEPATALLKRIEAEKKRLVKEGKTKKLGDSIAIQKPNNPFELPASWAWSNLAQLGQVNPRNSAADNIEAGFIPMPLISSDYGKIPSFQTRKWGDIKSGFTHFTENDVGLAKITPCFQNSKAAIFRGLPNGIGAGTTELHVFRDITQLLSCDYIYLFLKTPRFLSCGEKVMTGSAGQKRVPSEYFALTPLPLPPLAEQKRIVAKVDELMTFCDQLEAHITKTQNLNTHLMDSLIHRMIEAA